MMRKIRSFLRRLLLLHDKSDQPTSLMPLRMIHTAVVLRDSEDSSLDQEISAYFKRQGIKVRMMSRREQKLRSKEELFISLVPDADIDELYAAVTSRAKFKVGSHPLKYDVYDLVVSRAKGGDFRQKAVFEAITKMLEKIQ